MSANLYTGVCKLVYRCLQTHIPVPANLYTGVCELVYQCLRTCIPVWWTHITVFVKLYTAHTFCWELVSLCLQTCIPVSANLCISVCKLVYRCFEIVYSHPSIQFHKHRYTSSRHRYELTDTGMRVHIHQYTSSQTPVYKFTHTGIQVHRHRYTSLQTPGDEFPTKSMGSIQFHKHWYMSSWHWCTSSQTPVYKFTDTGIQVHRHWYISSHTPVYKFADTGRRVSHKMYGQYTISQTPVYEFTDTGSASFLQLWAT